MIYNRKIKELTNRVDKLQDLLWDKVKTLEEEVRSLRIKHHELGARISNQPKYKIGDKYGKGIVYDVYITNEYSSGRILGFKYRYAIVYEHINKTETIEDELIRV